MSLDKAKKHLEKYGFDNKIKIFEVSSATVELAAKAIGCEPQLIVKTLSFDVNGKSVLICAAGDAKIDNPKYKAFFGTKAAMLQFSEVESRIGHAVGGVCPFGVNEDVEVYLDESLKRFETVYPAAGESNNCVCLTIDELEKCSEYKAWIDVCKIPQ